MHELYRRIVLADVGINFVNVVPGMRKWEVLGDVWIPVVRELRCRGNICQCLQLRQRPVRLYSTGKLRLDSQGRGHIHVIDWTFERPHQRERELHVRAEK